MPFTDLRARQQRQKYEIRQLLREVDGMREQRLAAEAALEVTKQEASPSAPEPEAKKSGGGKWFGNGDRIPSPEEMKSKNLPEILKEFDRLIKESK